MNQVASLAAARMRRLLPTRPVGVAALVSSFNAADVIDQVIGDLIGNGCQVYLLDQHSSDDTVARANQWRGKGLADVELFPASPDSYEDPQELRRAVLNRKLQLAGQLDAGWIIHVDADELHESPWSGLSLAEALGVVDALGYSAVNFSVFRFYPVDNDFSPGDDLRERFRFYTPAQWDDAAQIKAWKNMGQHTELAAKEGVGADLADRRVFPVPFLLRSYALHSEVHDSHQLQYFDDDAIKADLFNRTLEAVLIASSVSVNGVAQTIDPLKNLAQASRRLGREVTPEAYMEACEELTGILEVFERDHNIASYPHLFHAELVEIIAQMESARRELSGDLQLSLMWEQIRKELMERPASLVAPANLPQCQPAQAPTAAPVAEPVAAPAPGQSQLEQTAFLSGIAAMLDEGNLDSAYHQLLDRQADLAGHPEYLFQLGRVGLLSGMLEDANNIFLEAIRLDAGMIRPVVKAYQQFLRGGPQRASAMPLYLMPSGTLLERAKREIASDQYEEAFATLNQALQERPEDPEIIFQMGVLAQTCSMHADAQELFYQAGLRSDEMCFAVLAFLRAQLEGQGLVQGVAPY